MFAEVWGGVTAAASTVTVLGSSALGGVAVALGLASPPLWPAVACGAAGLAGSYAYWRLNRPKVIRTLMIGPPMP